MTWLIITKQHTLVHDNVCPVLVLQETFVPLPTAEGPAFVYVAPEVINDGPTVPDMEVLAARG